MCGAGQRLDGASAASRGRCVGCEPGTFKKSPAHRAARCRPQPECAAAERLAGGGALEDRTAHPVGSPAMKVGTPMLRPTGQQPVGRQGLAPPSGPTAATSSGSASTSLSALPFTSGSGHAGSRSYPPLPQDTATALSLDPASLASSGCPYKQAIDVIDGVADGHAGVDAAVVQLGFRNFVICQNLR